MTQNFGFTATIKEKILAILRSNVTIEKAVIFGSRAKNTYKIGSDVDLAIWQKPGSNVLAKIKADFEESSLPYFFDVLDYRTIANEKLRQEIDRDGKIFYFKDDGV